MSGTRHTITFTAGLTSVKLNVTPNPDLDPGFDFTCSCGVSLELIDQLCVEKAPPGTSIQFVVSGSGFTASPPTPTITLGAAAPSEQLLPVEVTRTTERGTKKKKVTLKVSTESNPGTDGGHGVIQGPQHPPEPPPQSFAPTRPERASQRKRKGKGY